MECPFCTAVNDETSDTCFQCGRSLFSLTKGTLLNNRYEIVDLVGKGGMGVVYKAHDRELEETVALKILRPDVATSREATMRFRSEIKLARRIRHRNVCAIHEYGTDGRQRYIAMEFVEGVNLSQIVHQQGALPSSEAFDVAIQIAHGLKAIHEAGIVHRDLKPLNVMREPHGAIHVMDFGIAKRFDMDTTGGVTATGHIIGTPEYMSPEQVRGEKLDARSDLYSLGVLLFELLTGHVPYRGDTPMMTLLRHLQGPPLLESPHASKLPSEIVPILTRLLARDRDARFNSAAEVIDTLERLRGQQSQAPAGSLDQAPTQTTAAASPISTPFVEKRQAGSALPSTNAASTTRLAWARRRDIHAIASLLAILAAITVFGIVRYRASRHSPAPSIDGGRPTSRSPVPTPVVTHTAAVASRIPTQPAAPRGTLEIDTAPFGAMVLINGKFRGTAPLIIEGLLPGELLVRAEAPGYRAVVRTVLMRPGARMPLMLVLERATKAANPVVTSDPSAVEWYLNGSIISRTPSATPNVKREKTKAPQ